MSILDDDDVYLLNLVDLEDKYLIDTDLVKHHSGYGKNYYALQELILDAGTADIEEEGLIKLKYYLYNLFTVDSLQLFIDDQSNGLLDAAYFLLADRSIKTEAILRYIVGHRNVKFHQQNVIRAAGGSNYIFFKLIELGGKVHHDLAVSNGIPLHIAVLGKRTKIIKYILDQNVDVNCLSLYFNTALHYALRTNNNFEIIELLLQKGADMYSRDGSYCLTPFEYAIKIKQFNNAAFLLNAKLTDKIITFDLIKAGFSLFCEFFFESVERYQTDFISHFVKPEGVMAYYDFFKLLCEKLIKHIIANNNVNTGKRPILSIYVNTIIHIFESNDWANALKLLLTSEIASTLLEECLSYEKKSIFALLIPKLVEVKVEQEDRIQLLKLLLSLGMVPNLKDMVVILTHYRFNEEFQLLSLSLPDDCLLNDYNQENPMEYIASVFCGLEKDLDYNRIFGEELPEKFYDYIKQYFTPALSNCSSNANYRNSETNLPSILSLQELSRNSARKLIKKNRILSPRDFISAVDSLPIPLKCKNYILLKTKVDEIWIK